MLMVHMRSQRAHAVWRKYMILIAFHNLLNFDTVLISIIRRVPLRKGAEAFAERG